MHGLLKKKLNFCVTITMQINRSFRLWGKKLCEYVFKLKKNNLEGNGIEYAAAK